MALFNWNQKIIYIHTYIYTYIQIAYTRVEWVWTIWWQERVECLLFLKKCPFEVFISHRNWSLVVFSWKIRVSNYYHCKPREKSSLWKQKLPFTKTNVVTKKIWKKSLYKIFSYFEIVIPSSHFRILTLFTDHWVSSNPKIFRL